jgi:signal peptidase II
VSTAPPGAEPDGARLSATRARPRWTLAAAVAVAVLVFDQITKAWAVAVLDDGPIDLIDGFARFALARNPGAAFSILQDRGTLLAIFALVTVGVILTIMRDLHGTADVIGLALVLGGAVGNLADRVFRGPGVFDGAVVDFVDIGSFPSFNVADSAITIGVILVLFGALRRD